MAAVVLLIVHLIRDDPAICKRVNNHEFYRKRGNENPRGRCVPVRIAHTSYGSSILSMTFENGHQPGMVVPGPNQEVRPPVHLRLLQLATVTVLERGSEVDVKPNHATMCWCE